MAGSSTQDSLDGKPASVESAVEKAKKTAEDTIVVL